MPLPVLGTDGYLMKLITFTITWILPTLLLVSYLPHHKLNALKPTELGFKNLLQTLKSPALVLTCIHWLLNHIGLIGKHAQVNRPVKAKVVHAAITRITEMEPESVLRPLFHTALAIAQMMCTFMILTNVNPPLLSTKKIV
jgi:hypothetical protein